MLAQEIRARFEALVSQRKTLDQTWEAIANTMMPYRGVFFRDMTSEHEVQWRRPRHIYDSTAPMAIQTLAASLHGSLTSPATKWFELEFRDKDLRDDKESADWMANANKETYQELQDSNFNLEANEGYTDLVGFGTSIITQEEDDESERKGAFQFQAVPPDQVYFEQDHRGRVCRMYRKFMWTPLQIVKKFGEKVPDTVKTKAKSTTDVDEKMMVIFCIFDRAGKKYKGKELAAKERPYGFKYILHDCCSELGEEGGYYEMPAYAPRWRKTSDSMWGNSPAMMALADVLTLNDVQQKSLQALGKVVDPSNMATERGLLSHLDLQSGGLTIVRDRDSVWPYESRARFGDVKMEKDDIKASIRSAFYVDQLELKNSPAMTATEVQVRYELMQRLLGPTLGRLEHDFLSPLIERSFAILQRAGRFGEPSKMMQDKGEQVVMDVKYTGPLARAQRIDKSQSIQRWLVLTAELGEMYPELRDLPDIDVTGRELADLEGVPSNLLKDKTKINTDRKNRKEAAGERQAIEDDAMMGQARKVNAEADNLEQQQST